MPEPPPGEAGLRALAAEFVGAEAYVGIMLAEAAIGERAWATKHALEQLAKLRLLDFELPVVAAYLAEHPKGRADAVKDLSGSLTKRLDSAAKTAGDGVRGSFRKVTKDNLQELLLAPTTAAIDQRGTHWQLGPYAVMATNTIGRQATSRGLAHAIGEGGRVTITVGQCGWCQSHAGEGVIGQVALPPFHPSCTCVASPA